MYDVRPLEKIDEKIQEEINEVLEKYKPLLQEKISKQLRPTDTLLVGMGSAVIINAKGEYIADKFSSHVLGYAWKDNFNSGLILDNIDRRKTKNND